MRIWQAVIVCLVAMSTALPVSAQTVAGTQIVNTAWLRFDLAGTDQSIASNTVTIVVAERLDVRLVRDGGNGAVIVSPGQPTVVPLMLTNLDNGAEAFLLDIGVSAGAIEMRTLAFDSNDDGRYDPDDDTIATGGMTPVLAPGQSMRLFAIVTASDSGAANATLTASARSATGSGVVGTVYPAMGDGRSDAVVGPTGGTATVTVPLTTAAAGPSLVKSQSVLAADGSTIAGRDAVVTYTLEARFTGPASEVRIADPIPDGTVFVPGSLRLDGVSLTDGDDDDAGGFVRGGTGREPGEGAGYGISVVLGNIAAASVHTVQFKTKIQ